MLAITLLALVVANPAHAGTVSRSGTTLVFTSGPGQNETLQVRQTAATVITFDDIVLPITTTAAPNCTLTVGGNITCTGVTWTKVVVDLRDGNDTMTGQAPNAILQVPAEVDGGAGQDQIVGGNVDDILDVGAGGGSANGMLGNDTLRASADGTTFLSGQDGNDTLDATATSATASISASGNAGNDTLRGGAANGTYNGQDGTDTLTGGVGSETLDGGLGADTINGGAGDDLVEGGSTQTANAVSSDGPDTLAGGPGNDALGYRSRSVAVTVDLTQTTNGETGENDVTALDFEAALGGSGNDTLFGNAGRNVLEGRFGNDTIDGRAGTDQLYGQGDADVINGSSDREADLIHCGSTVTTTPAGTDNDVANLDDLDILELLADCETVNRTDPPAPQTPPRLGNAQSNVLRGGPLADLLQGNAGNDTLRGLGGNDLLRGGIGNDLLFGGAGNDDLDGDSGADQLFGDAGNDTLDGGPGRDLLRGGAGTDTLVGGRGVDNLDGGPGKDYLFGNDGARLDVITCTRVNLRNRFQRLQRDVVVASRGDVIVNRAWCARVTFA